MKYRKKPIVIEAVQFIKRTPLNSNVQEIIDFVGTDNIVEWEWDEIIIKTLEGNMVGRIGDYIIKGIKGEFYLCRCDIFELTYELDKG